jgi:hypothetical protein
MNSRFCHFQGCGKSVVVCVKGLWYCSDHKPVLFTDEDVRKHGEMEC